MAYPTGQCTWYVWHQLAFIRAIDPNQNLGDAHSWLTTTHARGLHTGAAPRVGSAVCFQPNVDLAGSVGHVAVVTQVAADSKSFSVLEMDFPRAGTVDSRSGVAVRAGVGFIYNPSSEVPVLTPSQKHAMVRLAYISALGRQPEPAGLAGWSGLISDDGSNVDDVMVGITESPEGKDFMGRQWAIVRPPGSPPGPAQAKPPEPT